MTPLFPSGARLTVISRLLAAALFPRLPSRGAGKEGELWYPDGSRYAGTFSAGKRDGRGTYYFPGGQQLSGKWSADYIEENGAWAVARQP